MGNRDYLIGSVSVLRVVGWEEALLEEGKERKNTDKKMVKKTRRHKGAKTEAVKRQANETRKRASGPVNGIKK